MENTALENSVRGTCSSRSFKSLMATQFLGALNDNIFRTVVSLIIVSSLMVQESGITYLCLSEVFFLFPFIIFSPYAGFFADKFSKSTIVRVVKVLEVLITGVGFYYLLYPEVTALVVVLFFMGVHSTLFSPAKYGLLPELLSDRELSRGNGYIEFWTFLAIILGLVLGGVLKEFSSSSYLLAGLVVFFVAVVGLIVSFFIEHTPAQNPNLRVELRFWREVSQSLREVRESRGLLLSLLAVSYFWLAGTVFKLNTILYAKHLLHASDLETALLFAFFAVGIGMGSIVAGKVSEGKVELGLVPLGGIGITLFSGALGFTYDSFYLTMFVLLLLGYSAGFFIVPLNSYFQKNSPTENRGRFVAALNFCSFSAMCLGCAFVWLLLNVFGLRENQLFLAVSLLSITVTVMVVRTLPAMLVRCLNWALMHTVYRVKVLGREHVPESGGALIVCNHVSYLDAGLLQGAIERPVRFMMYQPIYQAKLIHPIAKTMRAIPIDSGGSPKAVVRALNEAREAVQNGELVCIFAEGGLTRLGQLLPFQKGFERIMKDVSAPIIPVYLDQIWGSIFSFQGGKFFWKLPRMIPYPVTIAFGKPLAGSSKAFEVREKIQELGSEAFVERAQKSEMLHQGFLRSTKARPLVKCLSDSSGISISYFAALVRSIVFAQALRKVAAPVTGEMVGVMLPPSVMAALSNLSVLMAGGVPVNLNYTAGAASLASSMTQCSIRSVLTSRAFLEKLKVEPPAGAMFVEDLPLQCSMAQKLKLLCAFVFLPRRIFERLYFVSEPKNAIEHHKQLATVIFSSGSTGEPKGVMLSHSNISSNIQAMYDVFQMKKTDAVMGVLPFFHSFGFTGTLWLPLLAGIRVVYHGNPIDSGVIGELVQKHKASILLATPTFLLGYLRKCSKEQFASLVYVIVGAEKLKERVAQAFHDKFGIFPLEGYGCTELSPVAVLNVPDYFDGTQKQVGQKLGTVGHPIPGVSVRIVDPESFQPLSQNTEGLLLVKGPNVMVGYLGNEAKTAEVIRDGWYVTGDIAKVDEDGFVMITDRLSRFSKIAGEMVPHVRIEEELHKVLGAIEQVCVVTSVPDDKKGEKLVVLTMTDFDISIIMRKLSEQGLPNLWIPKTENVHRVEALPLLGSGKLDLKAIKQLAQQKSQS